MDETKITNATGSEAASLSLKAALRMIVLAQTPRAPEPGRDARRKATANRAKILAALVDAADPAVPPSDDEILGLILGEMALLRAPRPSDAGPTTPLQTAAPRRTAAVRPDARRVHEPSQG